MDLNRLKLTLSCLIISGYVITGCTKEEGNSDNSGDKSKITEINQKSQKKPGMQTDSQEKHWKYIITGTRRFQKILTSLIRKRIVTQ